MTVSLKAMEYFTTALRHGSIVGAAAELNIAASAVSTAIDQVEAAFDLTLITRQRSRGIQPNASGLAVARKCERLLEEYRSLLTEGADLKQALSGTLRVGYYAPIAPAFLPEILSSFGSDAGEIQLHLEECDNDVAQEGLRNGTFDAILFVSDDVRPSIDFDVLIEAHAYCLVPKAHKLTTQSSVTMAEIAKEPLVVLNRPVVATYYRSLFDAQGHDISVAAYANSTEMVRSLVSAGHGCAVLNMKPLTLAVAYDKSRPRRLVKAFAEACREHFVKAGHGRCIVDL